MALDKKAFRQFTYGLYLITAVGEDGRRMGCVVNTAEQVSSDPYRVLFTLNKENATHGAVVSSGKCAVTVLNQDADMALIGAFGFQTSTAVDKFSGFDVRATPAGLPWVADAAAAVLDCAVEGTIDAGTHTVFCAKVTAAEACPSPAAPLTYDYYHRVLKGTTPPKASSFIGDDPAAADAPVAARPDADGPAAAEDGPATHHFRCCLCGYLYETSDEELPADFRCPMCGAGPDMFVKVD